MRASWLVASPPWSWSGLAMVRVALITPLGPSSVPGATSFSGGDGNRGVIKKTRQCNVRRDSSLYCGEPVNANDHCFWVCTSFVRTCQDTPRAESRWIRRSHSLFPSRCRGAAVFPPKMLAARQAR